MGPLIELENYVDMQCMRHLHVMSNLEFDQACLQKYGIGNGLAVREAGVWHLRAVHPFRGPLEVCCEGWKKSRRVVAWSLDGYVSVKLALFDAWKAYCKMFGGRPQYAFMRKLPNQVENGQAVPQGDGMSSMALMEAEWMLEKCIAVGGRQL